MLDLAQVNSVHFLHHILLINFIAEWEKNSVIMPIHSYVPCSDV